MRFFIAAVLLLRASAALAVDFTGREVIVPIVGRTPGASGSMWQTDLMITNFTVEYSSTPVTVEFFQGEDRASFELALRDQQTIVLEDFLQARLGRDAAVGMVRVSSSVAEARLHARAWIHDTAGDGGHFVEGLPVDELAEQSTVVGLSTRGGARVNFGIANPTDVTAEADVYVKQDQGHRVTQQWLTIPPRTVVQYPLPYALDDASVQVTSLVPVYAYASVIGERPQFVMATEWRPTSALVAQPDCASPATLALSRFRPAPGFIVLFREGTDPQAATATLAAKHGFAPILVYDNLAAFYAELTQQQIAALRCEPLVHHLGQGSNHGPVP